MKKKLMHYLSPVIRGGGEEFISVLMQEQKSYECHLVLGARNENLERFCNSNGIRVSTLRILGSKQNYKLSNIALRSALQIPYLVYMTIRNRPDIIHIHSFPGNLLGPAFNTLCIGRSVLTRHSKYFDSPSSRFLRKFALRSFDTITYVSKSSVEEINDLRHNEHIVTNPVHKIFFKEYERCFYSNTKVLRAIFIGRLTKQKGIGDFLERLTFLKNDYAPKLQISIIGSGNEFKRLRALEEKLPAFITLNFHSELNRDEIYQEITQSDFGIHPSYLEGFSLVCAQYRAMALPVLAWDTQANEEVLGKGALYFNNESLEAKLNTMLHMEVRKKLSEYSRKNRTFLHPKYSARRYEELYQ